LEIQSLRLLPTRWEWPLRKLCTAEAGRLRVSLFRSGRKSISEQSLREADDEGESPR
jgi:hypothetical protein